MTNQGFVRQHESFFNIAHQSLDLIAISLTLWPLCLIYDQPWSGQYQFVALFSMILFVILAKPNRLYDSWRAQTILSEVVQVMKVWLWVLFLLLFVGFALKLTDQGSRLVLGTWAILTPTLITLIRVLSKLFLRYLRSSGHNVRQIAIAGSGPLAQNLVRVISASPWMGMENKGFYDSVGSETKGDFNQLVLDAREGKFDQIYIALPMIAEKELKQLVAELADCSVQVHYVPDIFTFNLMNSRIRDVGGIPTISLYDSPLDGFGHFMKRAEDILIGSFILTLISIPMLAIGIAVRATSPGPALFKQRRYGLAGEEIWVWKFRSMTVCEDGAAAKQATKNDSRITPVGAFIRKTSLDELPQFINVIQGTMSIVGPRPHPIALNEQFRGDIDGYMLRHMVKPGITGWAQINGWRGETDTMEKMEKRIEYDLHYIRNWSLGLDLRIIFLTVFKGFINKNAY